MVGPTEGSSPTPSSSEINLARLEIESFIETLKAQLPGSADIEVRSVPVTETGQFFLAVMDKNPQAGSVEGRGARRIVAMQISQEQFDVANELLGLGGDEDESPEFLQSLAKALQEGGVIIIEEEESSAVVSSSSKSTGGEVSTGATKNLSVRNFEILSLGNESTDKVVQQLLIAIDRIVTKFAESMKSSVEEQAEHREEIEKHEAKLEGEQAKAQTKEEEKKAADKRTEMLKETARADDTQDAQTAETAVNEELGLEGKKETGIRRNREQSAQDRIAERKEGSSN